MARVEYPDCGFVHECDPHGSGISKKEQKGDKKSRVTRGYSIYYVLCRCGCGCGHSCEMKYGPYGKSHKSQGIAALQGEESEKLRALREASAKTRKSHLAKNTWIKNNLDVMDIKGCKTSKLRKYFSDVGDVSEFIDTPVNRFTSKYVICK